MAKALGAAKDHGLESLIVAGGVAANSRLRQVAAERCAAAKIELRTPPIALCTDNGAMVAALTSLAVSHGAKPSSLGLAAESATGLEQLLWS